MTQPENSFRTGVHKYLPPTLHHEKMHNPYRGGTPDDWYSGKRDMWVEYKFEQLPKRESTLVPIDLSELQKQWLAKRHAEGRNVHVVVGCSKGGVVFSNLEWLTPLNLKSFLDRTISRKDLAAWILQQTGGPP